MCSWSRISVVNIYFVVALTPLIEEVMTMFKYYRLFVVGT